MISPLLHQNGLEWNPSGYADVICILPFHITPSTLSYFVVVSVTSPYVCFTSDIVWPNSSVLELKKLKVFELAISYSNTESVLLIDVVTDMDFTFGGKTA